MLLDQQIAPLIFWNKHLKIQLLSQKLLKICYKWQHIDGAQGKK